MNFLGLMYSATEMLLLAHIFTSLACKNIWMYLLVT